MAPFDHVDGVRTLNVCKGTAMSETFGNPCTELQIARAYLRLTFVSQREDGAKTVSLGRCGSYEVLLMEPITPSRAGGLTGNRQRRL
jgi:hypothetical protein